MLLAQANLHYFTQRLTQFGVSTGQRPSPVGDVNAATLFLFPLWGKRLQLYGRDLCHASWSVLFHSIDIVFCPHWLCYHDFYSYHFSLAYFFFLNVLSTYQVTEKQAHEGISACVCTWNTSLVTPWMVWKAGGKFWFRDRQNHKVEQLFNHRTS